MYSLQLSKCWIKPQEIVIKFQEKFLIYIKDLRKNVGQLRSTWVKTWMKMVRKKNHELKCHIFGNVSRHFGLDRCMLTIYVGVKIVNSTACLVLLLAITHWVIAKRVLSTKTKQNKPKWKKNQTNRQTKTSEKRNRSQGYYNLKRSQRRESWWRCFTDTYKLWNFCFLYI